MPLLINIPTHKDSRGSLSVIEDELGYTIKRVFFIYQVSAPRGGHGHKKTRLALTCLSGRVLVEGQTPTTNFAQILDNPSKCLLLAPEDWHTMSFSDNGILFVCASEKYSKDDYFYEPYR